MDPRTLNHVIFDWAGTLSKESDLSELAVGAMDAIRELKRQGVHMSILSSLREEALHQICATLKLTPYFDRIEGSAYDKGQALSEHLILVGADPEKSLMIGDSPHDLSAARENGVASGCVLNHRPPQDALLNEGPRFVWNGAEEWLPFFESFGVVRHQTPPSYPVSAVGGLIENPAGEVFLVLTPKWGYRYGLPGGKIEKGESAETALLREIGEETALVAHSPRLLLLQEFIDSPEFYQVGAHIVALTYALKTESTAYRLNDEAVGALWIDPKLALKLPLNAPTRELIEAFLSHRA